jgi:hypothetical protein
MNLLETPKAPKLPINAVVVKGALSKVSKPSGASSAKSVKRATSATKPVKAAKPAKPLKPSSIRHPDGTIFYRADRKGREFICMLDGIQKAARPTLTHCYNFFFNQGFTGKIVELDLPK